MTNEPAPQLLGSIPLNSPAHRRLVETLTKLRDSASSEEDEKFINEILEGKRSAREIVDSPRVMELASQGFQRYEEQRSKLSDQEREDLDRQAAEQMDSYFAPED